MLRDNGRMLLIPNEMVEGKSDGERGAEDVFLYSIYFGMSKVCAFADLDFSYNIAILYREPIY